MSPQTSRILVSVLVAVLAAGTAVAGDVFLGITMDSLTPSMARALQLEEGQGVLINEIVEDSPAEAGGLEAGDVILVIEDYDISGPKSLSKAIRANDPGDEVTITVLRAGSRLDFDVVLGERKSSKVHVYSSGDHEDAWSWFETDEDEEGRKVFRWRGDDEDKNIVISGLDWTDGGRGFLGVVPDDRDRDELREMGVPRGRGVYITELVDDGPAKDAGLEAGDVILAIDDDSLKDGDDLHEALADTEPGDEVTVRVFRDGQIHEYDVELASSPGLMNIGKNLRVFMPEDPHNPTQPRFYEFHSGMDLEDMELEREDLAEMKDELKELKEELKQLREELQKKR